MTRTFESGEIEWCARAAHEQNRLFSKLLGDSTHLAWEDAPDWMKRSARLCAAGVLTKNHTPEESHNEWVAEKKADGWSVGPKKDLLKKEHPCLVAYADLEPAQRVKNELFISTVRAFANALAAIPSQ